MEKIKKTQERAGQQKQQQQQHIMKTAACVVVVVVVVPWSQGHLSVNALCGLPSRVYRTTSPTLLSFPFALFAYL